MPRGWYNPTVKQKQPLLTRRHKPARVCIYGAEGSGLREKAAILRRLFFLSRSRRNRRCVRINDLMINEEIRDREVRLIDQNGEQLGVVPTRQAQDLADERQLDLVKIAPQAKPPVCKLMDYGKYRFEQSKREREIRKNQKIITIKEVRLSATIEDHDVDVKYKNAVKFLMEGNKVKVTIRFRGRQITHSEIGLEVMKDFAERIKDVGVVERRPLIEGRNMIMIVAPKEIN